MFQIPLPTDRARTVNEWRRLLGRRQARLKELERLQAPDMIVQNEHNLIAAAKQTLNKLLS